MLLLTAVWSADCKKSDSTDAADSNREANRAEAPTVGIAVGSKAPDFSATTLDSKSFRLSDQRGKFVLIDFWGTWCRPCLGEIPYLKKANQVFSKSDLQIVSIAMDPLPTLQKFVSQHDMSWTHIQQDYAGPLLTLYQIRAFPTTILVNPEGIIVAQGIELRQQNLEKTLQKFVSKTS